MSRWQVLLGRVGALGIDLTAARVDPARDALRLRLKLLLMIRSVERGEQLVVVRMTRVWFVHNQK